MDKWRWVVKSELPRPIINYSSILARLHCSSHFQTDASISATWKLAITLRVYDEECTFFQSFWRCTYRSLKWHLRCRFSRCRACEELRNCPCIWDFQNITVAVRDTNRVTRRVIRLCWICGTFTSTTQRSSIIHSQFPGHKGLQDISKVIFLKPRTRWRVAIFTGTFNQLLTWHFLTWTSFAMDVTFRATNNLKESLEARHYQFQALGVHI